MLNIVDLTSYRSRPIAIVEREASSAGQVLHFAFPTLSPRDLELRALRRATIGLMRAKEEGDTDELADWKDEIEVIALYTKHFDVHERCRLALTVQ